LAVTPDGKRAISGSYDMTLKVWNLDTGEEIFTFDRHIGSINGVKITLDGERAISISEDSSLRIWNVWTGVEIASFVGESAIRCCAISSDELTIIAGEDSGRVHFLRLEGMDKLQEKSHL
jgi:WD40 repeat protein